MDEALVSVGGREGGASVSSEPPPTTVPLQEGAGQALCLCPSSWQQYSVAVQTVGVAPLPIYVAPAASTGIPRTLQGRRRRNASGGLKHARSSQCHIAPDADRLATVPACLQLPPHHVKQYTAYGHALCYSHVCFEIETHLRYLQGAFFTTAVTA